FGWADGDRYRDHRARPVLTAPAAFALSGGRMVRDARPRRAPHHEGVRPHPEEHAPACVSKDEATDGKYLTAPRARCDENAGSGAASATTSRRHRRAGCPGRAA